ncbi:MAG: sulfurtransferase [Gammaproteobacteria bacterium]
MKHIKKITLFLVLSLATLSQSYAASIFIDSQSLLKKLNNDDLVIIDMSDDTQYQRFHLPKALYLPYRAINQRNKQHISKSIGSDNVAKLLSYMGVTEKNDIVIYDDMAGLHAARLYWELERLGHKKVAILNGGLVSWVLNNYKVTNKPFNPVKSNYVPSKSSSITVASLSDVMAASKDSNIILLDVRSKEEYYGNPKNPRSGHIPTARWWQWQQAVDFENGFTQRKSSELMKSLQTVGVSNKNTDIIVYCQSGHRASQTYMTLKNLGFKKVRLYDGSMAEYSSNKTAPLIKGKNPK